MDRVWRPGKGILIFWYLICLEKVFQFSGILFAWKRYFNYLVSYLPGKGFSIFWYLICMEKVFQFSDILFAWKRYFKFLVFYLSGSLEKVFLSQKVNIFQVDQLAMELHLRRIHREKR